MFKLKTLVLFIKAVTNILLFRPFGRIIYDVAGRYEDLDVVNLRSLEKLSVKFEKIKNDIAFLKNCQTFKVFPKFLCFNLPHSSQSDANIIRKRLLRSAIHKRITEKKRTETKLKKATEDVKNVLSGLDWFIIKRCIEKNVHKQTIKVVETHQKKLQHLTHNATLPDTADDVITNLSDYDLSDNEKLLLKNGLKYAIPPARILRSDVFTTFEMLNSYLTSEVKDKDDKKFIKCELSYLANNYATSYKPSNASLKKHSILKKLRNNKDIIITKPDKGNGVVIMNRTVTI